MKKLLGKDEPLKAAGALGGSSQEVRRVSPLVSARDGGGPIGCIGTPMMVRGLLGAAAQEPPRDCTEP
eukprot:5691837-Prymnesium_polylepis.2